MRWSRLLRIVVAVFAVLCAGVVVSAEEPLLYVVQKGDTLWGISERFIRDPWYWPRMWKENSPKITNPHFIYPGQRLKIYHDRIEVVGREESGSQSPARRLPVETPEAAEKEAPVSSEQVFPVSGGEGIIAPADMQFEAVVSAVSQSRTIAGEDDIVYVTIGSDSGAKAGDRFRIFERVKEVRHPVTNRLIGIKLLQLGTLQLTEVERTASKAIITSSFREVEPGAVLLPHREPRRSISLKKTARDLAGMIVETRSGNKAIAAGDVCYLDLGASHGVEVGNMLYVVRDVTVDSTVAAAPLGKLPPEVVGAVLVVDVAEQASTALVIKSVDTVYMGDRVEMKAP